MVHSIVHKHSLSVELWTIIGYDSGPSSHHTIITYDCCDMDKYRNQREKNLKFLLRLGLQLTSGTLKGTPPLVICNLAGCSNLAI